MYGPTHVRRQIPIIGIWRPNWVVSVSQLIEDNNLSRYVGKYQQHSCQGRYSVYLVTSMRQQ